MPAISPRTQAMGQLGGTSDQAKALFDQGLSQMAYNVLLSKLPNVAPDVVTFKVLDTNHEEGSGIGAFVLSRRGQTLYVPIVMADNQIKPLDILYYKDLNVFMPLTKEWLAELDKQSLGELGQGVTPPKTLATDVDIRNTVVPPTTGRYSYAEDKTAGTPKGLQDAARKGLLWPRLRQGSVDYGHQLGREIRYGSPEGRRAAVDADKRNSASQLNIAKENREQSRKFLSPEDAVKQASRVFDEARVQHDTKLAFLDFLQKAPARVKKAAARLFETNPRLLKQAVWFYGEEPVIASLKLADYGGGIKNTGGALYVADDKTTSQEFTDIFGSKSPMAFSGVKLKGYYAKDDRKKVNRALAVQPFLDLQEPKMPGAYKLWKRDGKPVVALIVANPIDVFGDIEGKRIPAKNIRFRPSNEAPANRFQGHNSRYRIPGLDGRRDEFHADHYVGITEDGELIDTPELVGSQVAMSQLEGSEVFKRTVGEGVAGGPRKGQHGIFVQKRGGSFVATSPMTIDTVTSDFEGGRRIEVIGAWGKKTLVTDARHPGSKLMVPAGSDIAYLPSDFVWFPTKGTLSRRDFLTTPKDVLCWTTDAMLAEGAEKVKLSKYRGENGYNVGGEYASGFVPALRKLATYANISVEDAEHALKQADEQGRYEFWILAPEKLEKVAARLSVAEQQTQQADPAQQAMDQMQMAQMQQPQGPSPVDMAVAEQMQNIQAQMTALQQMQQMVQTIQQRASMIASGGGAGAAPAAAAAAMGGPMDPSMMGAGAAVPGMGGPPQQGQPGMDPNAMAQQSAMGGPPQQGQPGMDPNAMAQQQEPPMAMMSSDDGSVDTMVQQVNPQFMEQAGQLHDAGAFDAAALASMAQAPALKELVAGYLPNLEKSLDNLGRVLLTLWMDEVRIKGDIGDQAYIALEDNLRATFRGMGDLILKINQNTLILKDTNESGAYQG